LCCLRPSLRLPVCMPTCRRPCARDGCYCWESCHGYKPRPFWYRKTRLGLDEQFWNVVLHFKLHLCCFSPLLECTIAMFIRGAVQNTALMNHCCVVFHCFGLVLGLFGAHKSCQNESEEAAHFPPQFPLMFCVLLSGLTLKWWKCL
jgi:hypothetical protein